MLDMLNFYYTISSGQSSELCLGLNPPVDLGFSGESVVSAKQKVFNRV
jgi:hypothetical protein